MRVSRRFVRVRAHPDTVLPETNRATAPSRPPAKKRSGTQRVYLPFASGLWSNPALLEHRRHVYTCAARAGSEAPLPQQCALGCVRGYQLL